MGEGGGGIRTAWREKVPGCPASWGRSSHLVNVAKRFSPLPIINDHVLLREKRYQAPLCLPNSNVHILKQENVGMRQLDSHCTLALLNIHVNNLLFFYKTLWINANCISIFKVFTSLNFHLQKYCTLVSLIKHILLSSRYLVLRIGSHVGAV